MHHVVFLAAQAMQCMQRCSPELSHAAAGPVAYPQQVHARFVRPILLPAAVECRWRQNERCSQLSIVDQKSGKSFIEGSFDSGEIK